MPGVLLYNLSQDFSLLVSVSCSEPCDILVPKD